MNPHLRKVDSQKDGSQRFSVEFSLSYKTNRTGHEEKPTLFDFSDVSRKNLSKGKKIILALCVALALNSIEKVRLIVATVLFG